MTENNDRDKRRVKAYWKFGRYLSLGIAVLLMLLAGYLFFRGIAVTVNEYSGWNVWWNYGFAALVGAVAFFMLAWYCHVGYAPGEGWLSKLPGYLRRVEKGSESGGDEIRVLKIEELPETIICPKCLNEVDASMPRCHFCGALIAGEPPPDFSRMP